MFMKKNIHLQNENTIIILYEIQEKDGVCFFYGSFFDIVWFFH